MSQITALVRLIIGEINRNKGQVNQPKFSMSDQFCRNDDSLRLSDDEIPLDSLPSSVSILHDKHGNTIFFVGTAHVSNQSVDDVQEAIERVRPALVAIELCHHRTGVLHAEGTQIMEEQKSLPWYQLLANSIRSFFSWRTESFTHTHHTGASKSSSSGFFHFFMSRMLLTVSAQLKVSPVCFCALVRGKKPITTPKGCRVSQSV